MITRSQSLPRETSQTSRQSSRRSNSQANHHSERQSDSRPNPLLTNRNGNEPAQREGRRQETAPSIPTAMPQRSETPNRRNNTPAQAPNAHNIVVQEPQPLPEEPTVLRTVFDGELEAEAHIPHPLNVPHEGEPVPTDNNAPGLHPAPFALDLAPETRLIDIPFAQIGTLLGSSPTIVDIPSNMVPRVSALFVKFMNKIDEDSTDVDAWKKFLLLPTALFSHSQNKFKADMRKRSDALMQDNWNDITLGSLRRREELGGGARTDGVTRLHNRVLRQVKCGNLSKAMSMLKTGDKFVKPSAEIVEKLKAKNVVANEAALAPGEWETLLATNLADNADYFIEAKPDDVWEIVRRQRKLIKHGIGGLRYEHLVAMMGKDKRPTANQTQFRRLFARMVTLVANARVPQHVIPALRDNEIIAAPKGNEDVRPIVPTCVLRKIASAVLFRTTATFNMEYFKELQYALKKSGTEHIINTIRIVQEKNPDYDVFAMDGDNAFNRVSRRMGLQTIRQLCPHVFPFLRMLYGASGRLWYYGMEDAIREIANMEGFLQGDGLALWAYIMTIHPFLRALREHVGLAAVIMFFVDDGNLAANFETMLQAIQFIIAQGPRYGYVLKKDKGSYLLGKCVDRATALLRKEQLVALGFSETIIHIHPDNASDAEDATALTVGYGAQVLGSFIGSDRYIKSKVHEKAVELTSIGSRLIQLPHVQSVMLLFRYCYCPMANHLMRTISPRLLKFLVNQHEYCKREVLAFILGYAGEGIPDRVAKWSHFNIAQGGLGLGNMKVTQHAAFAASFSTSLKTIKSHVPDILQLLENQSIPYTVDIRKTLVFIQNTGGFANEAAVRAQLLLERNGNVFQAQELLTKPMLQCLYNASLASNHLLPKHKAWIVSTSQYEAGAWLDAIPKTSELLFSNDEYQSALFYRYQLPQPIIPDGARCTCANRPQLDKEGHHAITGCKCGGGRQNTHDMLKHKVTSMLRYACVRSREEEIGIFRATDPGTSKRPDITVEMGTIYTQHAILDVSVTCPLPGAAATGAPGLSSAQAGVQGRAAAAAVQKKVGKYGALATGNQLGFIPLVFESPGYMHDYACAFFDKVAEYASKVKLIPKAAIYNFWVTQLSVTLQKALGHALYRRVIAAVNKEGGVNMGQAEVDVLDLNAIHITPN